MLEKAKNYKELADQFNWHIPEYYNIGVDVCDKWADTDPKRLALIHKPQANELVRYSFDDIRTLSNRTAQLLTEKGIQTGDRVGILLPQTPEIAFSHVAIYKMGAIAVPLVTFFGEEALEYRLNNCAAKAVITNSEGARKLISIRDHLTHLETIFNIDGAEKQVKPGVMGRPVPGRRISIIDEADNILDNGQLGNIGVHRPDPVMFLEYWHNPDATKEKFVGDWLLTGDKALRERHKTATV